MGCVLSLLHLSHGTELSEAPSKGNSKLQSDLVSIHDLSASTRDSILGGQIAREALEERKPWSVLNVVLGTFLFVTIVALVGVIWFYAAQANKPPRSRHRRRRSAPLKSRSFDSA